MEVNPLKNIWQAGGTAVGTMILYSSDIATVEIAAPPCDTTAPGANTWKPGARCCTPGRAMRRRATPQPPPPPR